MAADEKQVSALIRRHEQVKRWEGSETNLEPSSPKRKRPKVQFQDGCVFLAACSSGDKDEVDKLLQRGADINTANVDGLTALHQACIDDNLDMVEFLVEKGADVDVCDNEGWTPLHATASCAFTEIARYLINHKANVAAVNNDGDLPIDIAENEEMEQLLQDEMNRQGIDAEAARCEEEQRMLEDANEWLRSKSVEEVRHPKTGATALHVAAAKGYTKVMNVLLDAGADVNAEDYDGWTPLHAAAHWNQEEACKILAEHMCDMNRKNKAGHTAFDLAEKEVLKLLEELKEKQASARNKPEGDRDIILHSAHGGKRRSSVTRMSCDQKQNVIHRNTEEERAALSSLHPGKTEDRVLNNISIVADDRLIKDSETERENEKNKQVSLQPQVSDTKKANPQPPTRDFVSRSISIPARLPTQKDASSSSLFSSSPSSSSPTTASQNELSLSSWRLGLRKTGSTSTVHERMAHNDDSNNLARSSSSPRLTHDARLEALQERLAHSRLSSTSSISTVSPSTTTASITSAADTEGKPGDRNSYTFGQNYTGYRSTYGSRPSSYSSSYQQRQQQREALANTEEKPVTPDSARLQDRFSLGGVTTSASTTLASSGSSSYTPNASIISSTSSVFRRSYEPPKRDEETETQRKARAKHARQTRRSTQGVSLEDIEKAEESLKTDKDVADAGSTSRLPSQSIVPAKSAASVKELVGTLPIPTASTSTTTSSSTTTTTTSSLPPAGGSDGDAKEDKSVISGYRQRILDDKNDTADNVITRSSYRRSKDDKDLNSSIGVTSTYIPRSQRNSAQLAAVDTTPSSQNLSRTSSVRSSRQTEQVIPQPEEETKKEDGNLQEKKEEKKELSSIRARRQRRERRSTGIVMDSEDGETSKDGTNGEDKKEENTRATKPDIKPEEDKKDYNLGSSRYGRYNSNSDFSSQRPVSYSEVSKSTPSLDIDYKKKYEEEKLENERLRKELEETKKSLLEAKAELDRVMKQKDAARNADRDKRALERKLSEMEEELKKMETLKADNQRLKDENGALIRVISKLSK